MLEARDLRKAYATERGEVVAVRDVGLRIEPGEFVAVVGRSGSGKSTLLAMLGGLSRPTSGAVTLDGIDLWSLREAELAAFRNRKVGFVFQFAGLLPTLRVVDNVALPALMGGIGKEDAAYGRASELLARVGLGDRIDAYPAELSGGEQRRASLARAIVNAPPILLADEPTGDLDEDTEAEVLALMLEIHRRDRTALVVVTHDREIARRADRVVEIRGGSLVGSWNVPDRSPDRPSRLLHSRDPDPIPATPPVPAAAAPVRLGAGLGTLLLAVGTWLIPGVFLALSLNQGVAIYQRHILHQRRQARAALEDAALLWLRASIEDVAYGPGSSYSLTLALENLSPDAVVYAMSPSVRAYVQVGLTWQEVPVKSADGQEGRVSKVVGKHSYQFTFEPDVKEYTEQLAGYMHVRLTGTTLVSRRSEPGDDLVERVDDDYIHLKPHGADDAAILRKTRFPGKPPLWIPMPPH